MKFPVFHDINNESPSLFNHNYDRFIVELINLLRQELGVDYDRAIHIASITGKAYDRPEVHYHTFHHVNMIFDFVNLNGIELSKSERLAITFHDVIYYVRRELNEQNSALFMKSLLGGLIDPNILGEASCIITETGKHMDDIVIHNANKVMDLDLYSLALPWDDFLIANDAINKEYSKVLSHDEFIDRRKEFLSLFLNKKNIYRTEIMRNLLEKKARENLTNYIETLNGDWK